MLFDAVPHALAVVDRARVRAANPRLVRLLGHRAPESLVGSAPEALVEPEDRARLAAALERVLEGADVEPFDLDVRRFDGSHARAEVALAPLDDAPNRSALLALREVSHERQLEARVTRTERAATLGMLVAGVAHEINNPLAYALGSIDIADRRLTEASAFANADAEQSSAIRQCLDNAREGVDRVRVIVRDLSSLSRSSVEEASGVELERVLDSAVNLAWNEIRHRARVVKHYAGVPRVAGDSARFGQVFLNLLVNAAHAIPDGAAMDAEIRVVTREDAGFVVAEVHDTGVGMSSDVVAKIFDPFFTTKSPDVGTGLGLCICRDIVTASGGTIDVSTEVGKGSRFSVRLPVAQRAAETARAALREEEVPASTPARVLVVDDEPLLGQTLRFALQGQHDVVIVSSGREALSRLDHDSAFDAILCDLMMPDVSGIAVYHAVRERHPALADRFAFMTGGAFTPEAREFLHDYAGPRLEKPFNMGQLEELIARVVAAH